MKLGENYQVLQPYEFLADMKREAKRAHTRIWTQAMYFEAGAVLDDLYAIFSQAAHTGLDARIHSDWFSLKISDGNYLWPASPGFKGKLALFHRFTEAGVGVWFINAPSLLEHAFPYKGRNHMKLTIIDDLAYIGGMNYSDMDFGFADFMVKVTDRQLVAALARLYEQMENHKLRDQKIPIDKDTTLLVDGGKNGQSIILDEAVKAVRSAQISILHTCQFVPDGRFSNALDAARKRGCIVEVTSPKKNDFNVTLALLYKYNRTLSALKHQTIPVHFVDGMLHAKLTIIDEKLVIFGSNNLTASGIRMGTAEVALISSNEKLVKNLQAFYKSLGR